MARRRPRGGAGAIGVVGLVVLAVVVLGGTAAAWVAYQGSVDDSTSSATPMSVLPSHEPPERGEPPLWAGADFDVDFSDAPDGPVDDPRFALTYGPLAGPAAMPLIRDGAVTIRADIGAGYTQYDPPWKPRVIGAEWRFQPGRAATGSICLALWDRVIPEPYAVPDSPMHLAITPKLWVYGLWRDGEFDQIAWGELSEPLRTDGRTTYTAQVSMDGDTATITLPDGSTETVTDRRIASIPGNVLNWETFLREKGAKAETVRVWASR